MVLVFNLDAGHRSPRAFVVDFFGRPSSMALAFPPIAPNFLALFGASASVIWENPCMGQFFVVVPPPGSPGQHDHFASFQLPQSALPLPSLSEFVREVETPLDIPVIPEKDRSSDPPVCLHNKESLRVEGT